MTDPAACPRCESPIPPDSPERSCPRCMLLAGLGADAPGVPSAEEVGAKLPGFEILGVLGRGGMGVVWKARQKALDRIVALKVLPSDAAAEPGFAERFAREAKAMARLQHPNIVAVHDFGHTAVDGGGGLFWLVMEYVDGVNVREAMRAGRVTPKEALAIVPQICDALQYAHDRGVVHRDVKPENILLARNDGRVKVADFGLAKLMEHDADDRTLTGAGQVMGTPHYMAPEQIEQPAEVDHRADIYSLGVVFYEMLTGELPLGRFAPPSKRAGLDVRIDEVVMRSLERERERRWQRVKEVGTQVSAITSGRAGPASRRSRAGRRRPASLPAPAPDAPATHVSALALFGGMAVSAVLIVRYALFVDMTYLPFDWFTPLSWFVVSKSGDPALHTGVLLPAVLNVALATGWVASIVAWVRVRRSRGGLSGLWLAAIGMLGPLSPAMAVIFAPIVVWREWRQRRDRAAWRQLELQFAKRASTK